MSDTHVQIDLSTTHQTIDGFGVNINPIGHWRDGALRPVIDQLIDDLGVSIFRLDPYGFTNWIDPNGTGGPETLNPETLAAAYQSAGFQDGWALGRYLNERNAEFILNVSGIVPPWMCANDGITLTNLDAYVELLSSLVVWAREKEGLRFKLFGPYNETDLGPPEGPFIDPDTLTETTARLAARLREVGHGDIKLVVAEQGHYNLDYLRPLVKSTAVRDVISVIAMHCYGDVLLSGVPEYLQANGVGEWRYWLTEYGELEQTGEQEWEAAVNSTRRLLRGLRDGIQAALVWDAYDNWHSHDGDWTIWGIMRTARGLYTPKKRYYAAKQIYRLVPPCSRRVDLQVTGAPLSVVAFRTPSGGISLVGMNEMTQPVPVVVSIGGGGIEPAAAQVFITDRLRNFERIASFPFSNNIALLLPGESIFTFSMVSVDSPVFDFSIRIPS